jgi:2-keto-3-deoxy-L-rhamnonate aldolase RhmA
MTSTGALKQRINQGAAIIGSFMRTPSVHVAEVLGGSRLDLICIDTEHGPFDRTIVDLSLFALRARGMPAIVRVPAAMPEYIAGALDSGAVGIMVPHVWNEKIARDVARWSHFGPDGRGYAGGQRSSDYGAKTIAGYLQDQRNSTVLLAQIEDPAALDQLDAIAAVPDIDALFVGRMDLTVGLGASGPDDPIVIEAVEKICSTGKRHGRAIGMFVSDVSEVGYWRDRGASLFILSSDHRFLINGANQLADVFRAG